jgi:DNA-binding CsgD family transcriptional regulator
MPAPNPRIGDPLTNGELDVLRLAANGGTTATIGRDLNISPHAINSRLKVIYTKLGVHDRPHAVALVLRLGMLQLAEVDAGPYLAAVQQRSAAAEALIAEARRLLQELGQELGQDPIAAALTGPVQVQR